MLERRAFMGAAALCLAAGVARADAGHADVGVYAEPTLQPALRAAGRLFTRQQGAGLEVLSASAPLILAQIQHNSAEDLVVLPAPFMDEAERRGFIDPSSRRDAWRNRLVVAARAGDPAIGTEDLAALLKAGPIAVTDPTVAATIDGRAVLAALGLAGAAQIAGVATDADAAFMVTSGATRLALLCLTDVRANPALAVAALPDTPPVRVQLALNRHPPSRNAQAFYDFLGGPAAHSVLHQAGLEPA
jgi:ABC-type molybdate transport system substrate-binding protein